MNKKIFLSLGGLMLSTILAFGQANIMPAKPQSGPIVIANATIHIGNGRVINNGYIAFDKGKITAVGEGAAPVGSVTVIDAGGKQVYPGFICPTTSLGLVEFESVRATVDNEETGDLNPNVRSLIAYNTDSKVIPTVRSNGILLAQPTPEGGTISGQSSVMMLDGWNWEDAAYKKDIAIHLTWPVARQAGRGRRAFVIPGAAPQETPAERAQKAIDAITTLFAQAKGYAEIAHPAVENLRLESMKGLFNGTKKLFVTANGGKEIIQAVTFGKKMGVQVVIVGGKDAYLVTDLLKENSVPVILQETQTLPEHEEDDVYLPYKMPKILQDAGVLYGLSGIGFWRQRNLPFEAGEAVGYGLTKEQALSMITINNAKILGIDKTTGTLEAGKDANLFISTGDALDMLTLNVETAFIQGKNINLDNLHKQLYKRYSEKYGFKQ